MELARTDVLEVLKESDRKYSSVPVEDIVLLGLEEVAFYSIDKMQKFAMDENMMNRLLGYFKIPKNYASRLSPKILLTLLQYHATVAKSTGRFGKTSAVFRRDVGLLGFTAREYSNIGTADVCEVVADELGGNVVARRYIDTPTHTGFTLTTDELQVEALSKDTSYFGLTVSYNRLGLKAPSITATSHRPICGNVFDSRESVSSVRFKMLYSPREVVLEKFRSSAREGIGYINSTLIPRLQSTTRKKVEDIDVTIRKIAKTHRLSDDVVDAVRASFATEPGDSLYYVVQALTRAANTQPSPIDNRLRRVAAALVDRVDENQCPSCLTAL